MLRSRQVTFASKAALIIVMVCLSLVGLDLWRTWTEHESDMKEASVFTANFSQSLAQHAEDTITAADTILVGLQERLLVDGTSEKALVRLHNLLKLRVAELPSVNGILIYDRDGNWIVNSVSMNIGKGANNSDREYFIYHRTHTSTRPHIGPVVKSRSTNELVFPVSRRINNADGSFGGVAIVTIKLDYFKNFYRQFDIGKHGVIILALDDGTLVLRRPFDDKIIGKDLTNGPLFRRLALTSAGSSVFTAAVDGVERQYSYRRVHGYPLIVATGLATSEVLAGWRANSALHAGSVAVLVLIFACMGFWLTRQIGLRSQAELDLLVIQDKLSDANKSLESMALQDSLTGIANRRRFDITLGKEYARALRHGKSLSLIMLDVDFFKQYNDLYGHPEGDECLRKIGLALQMCVCRPGDLAARYGGEEFAVILPETDLAGALSVAERIRQEILLLHLPHKGNPALAVTISAGAAAIKPAELAGREFSQLDLVTAADEALYLAKRGGRNRCVWKTVGLPGHETVVSLHA